MSSHVAQHTTQAKRGDTPQTKARGLSRPTFRATHHYHNAPWSEHLEQATKHSVFHFFFFFPVINSLRKHPFFLALVSSLFFGGREATTGNTSAVRRLVRNVPQREHWSSPWKHKRHGTFAISTNYETYWCLLLRIKFHFSPLLFVCCCCFLVFSVFYRIKGQVFFQLPWVWLWVNKKISQMPTFYDP